jgi:hypothetical protein
LETKGGKTPRRIIQIKKANVIAQYQEFLKDIGKGEYVYMKKQKTDGKSFLK